MRGVAGSRCLICLRPLRRRRRWYDAWLNPLPLCPSEDAIACYERSLIRWRREVRDRPGQGQP